MLTTAPQQVTHKYIQILEWKKARNVRHLVNIEFNVVAMVS